jgi:hypothetical protein
MPTSNPDYTSFLLRLWREPPASVERPTACPEPVQGQGRSAGHEWLVQVEHIPSGEKRYFASLEDCFAFIREQAAGAPALQSERATGTLQKKSKEACAEISATENPADERRRAKKVDSQAQERVSL